MILRVVLENVEMMVFEQIMFSHVLQERRMHGRLPRFGGGLGNVDAMNNNVLWV